MNASVPEATDHVAAGPNPPGRPTGDSVTGAAKQGSPGLAHYSASKFAVLALVQSLARELGEHGIRVNAICPGTVHMQMTDDLAEGGAVSVEDMLAEQVQKRPQTPTEIALDIAGLHVNAAVTGQSLNVDGGTVFH